MTGDGWEGPGVECLSSVLHVLSEDNLGVVVEGDEHKILYPV